MRKFTATALLAILLAAALLPLSARDVRAQSCTFVLGFATLHDLIPGVVGQCLSNEIHNPLNGDGLQPTVNGLMVWRKSDNWTAFTNGYQSWVNGPFGLQQRLNNERFTWEQNPDQLPLVPAAVWGDRCHTGQLSLSLVGTEGAAGSVFATFALTNHAPVPCNFHGFPGVQLMDQDMNPMPTNTVWGGGFLSNLPGPSQVLVPAAGGSATFRVQWGQVPVGDETTCPTSVYLAVTPPDEYTFLSTPIQITACRGGTLNVSAIQPQ